MAKLFDDDAQTDDRPDTISSRKSGLQASSCSSCNGGWGATQKALANAPNKQVDAITKFPTSQVLPEQRLPAVPDRDLLGQRTQRRSVIQNSQIWIVVVPCWIWVVICFVHINLTFFLHCLQQSFQQDSCVANGVKAELGLQQSRVKQTQ